MRCVGFFITIWAVLSGCDDPCEDLALTEPALEIGTGWQSFTPMEDLTYFERGSQGGYHVYASVRASGLFSGPTTLVGKKTPYITYTLQSEDETLTGGFTDVQRRMTVLPDGRIERLGDLAILSSYEPSEIEGVDVEIFAEIKDACGRSASATATTRLSDGF